MTFQEIFTYIEAMLLNLEAPVPQQTKRKFVNLSVFKNFIKFENSNTKFKYQNFQNFKNFKKIKNFHKISKFSYDLKIFKKFQKFEFS